MPTTVLVGGGLEAYQLLFLGVGIVDTSKEPQYKNSKRQSPVKIELRRCTTARKFTSKRW